MLRLHLNGFDNQERNLAFVKTAFHVLKLKFLTSSMKQAFYVLTRKYLLTSIPFGTWLSNLHV